MTETDSATPSTNTPVRLLRMSLRELMLITAFFAVSFALLRYANDVLWTIVSWVVLVGFMFLLVTAATASGRVRGFALGAALCASVYAFLVFFVVDWRDEAGQLAGTLPTSKASMTLYVSMLETHWTDAETNERLKDNDPLVTAWINSGGGFGSFSRTGRQLQYNETPNRYAFLPIANVLWAIIFAYLGGRLGAYLAQRRETATSP